MPESAPESPETDEPPAETKESRPAPTRRRQRRRATAPAGRAGQVSALFRGSDAAIAAVLGGGMIVIVLVALLISQGGVDIFGGGGGNTLGVKSELVTAADHAAAMVVAPDGRLFYAEQYTGNIRVVSGEGEVVPEAFASVEPARHLNLEWGLTGLALDPDFESNHYVYAFVTEPVSPAGPAGGPVGKPVVIRFTDQDNKGADAKVIVELPDTVPEHPDYDGNGRLHFGPDGFLYLSVGDYDTATLVQDLSNPIGKILRVSKEDGSPAPDNPLIGQEGADPRIYAYGFREPFDFVFHPQTDRLYGSDNTPVSCEEINIIQPGGNYGWPDVGAFPFSDCAAGNQVQAIYRLSKERTNPGDFLSFVVISGLEFVSGDVYPKIGDALLVCEHETMLMRRLVLDGPQFEQVSDDDVVVEDCDMDIASAPDGTIYYSNQQEIRRLVPPESEE